MLKEPKAGAGRTVHLPVKTGAIAAIAYHSNLITGIICSPIEQRRPRTCRQAAQVAAAIALLDEGATVPLSPATARKPRAVSTISSCACSKTFALSARTRSGTVVSLRSRTEQDDAGTARAVMHAETDAPGRPVPAVQANAARRRRSPSRPTWRRCRRRWPNRPSIEVGALYLREAFTTDGNNRRGR